MKVAETYDIVISVVNEYVGVQSDPSKGEYFFAYRINIQNNSDYTVKLLRRKWFIADSGHEIKEVEGEGVVGLQPVLKPGEFHAYMSGCQLETEIGAMWGFYIFERQYTDERIEVEIPRFELIAPWLNN